MLYEMCGYWGCERRGRHEVLVRGAGWGLRRAVVMLYCCHHAVAVGACTCA